VFLRVSIELDRNPMVDCIRDSSMNQFEFDILLYTCRSLLE